MIGTSRHREGAVGSFRAMQIHVARDGQRLGPFSIEEVRARLSAGEIRPTDLAWSEGRADWVPLASFPGIAEPAVPGLPQTGVAGPPPLQRIPPPVSGATSGLAIASLVCGILSVTFLPFLAAIPAIVCGHMAQGQIRRAAGALRGGGLALAGLIIGYLSFVLIIPMIAILAGIALPVFGEVQLRGKQMKSMAQAKQIAIGCKMYATEHDDLFPKTLEELVPEFLDPYVFVCPLSPAEPMGYEYFGGKDTDPPENVLLVSKAADRRGRRVVIHVDASGAIEKYTPGLPSATR